MDTDLFDFDLFYGTKFTMNKATRLEYGESKMTHAMLFTGVDLDLNGNPVKWRVENSWGDRNGEKGFYIMSDKWFDEYLYCLLYTSPSPRDKRQSRMPSSA